MHVEALPAEICGHGLRLTHIAASRLSLAPGDRCWVLPADG
jgi:hypothetical protein